MYFGTDDLIKIRDNTLSLRELDVLACVFNQFPTKKIASLLGISSSTIETHIRSLMAKAGCHTRKHIIQAVNNSKDIELLQSRFSLLLLEQDFKLELQSFAKGRANIDCIILYHDSLKKNKLFLKTLKTHLSMAGVSVTLKSWHPGKKGSLIIQRGGEREKKFVIYCLTKDFTDRIEQLQYNLEVEADNIVWLLENKDALIFLSLNESAVPINDYKIINFNTMKNYHSSILSLLQLFSPHHVFHQNLSRFDSEKNLIFSRKNQKKLTRPFFSLSSNQKSFKYVLTAVLIFILLSLLAIFIAPFEKQEKYKQQSTIAQNKGQGEMGVLLSLPARNAKFVGREKELKTINEFLNKYKFGVITQTIAGLGGVGKTQLASSYAYSSAEEKLYDTILWIRGETSASLNNSYIEFSKSLNMDIKGFQPSDIQRLIHAELKNFNAKNILFVLDNAAPSKYIEDYLNNLSKDFSTPSKLHILITSRSQKWHQDKLLLENFTKQEAYTFIKQYLPNEKDDSIYHLAQTLHYFPLAINQAIMYIQAHTNIDTYLELLKPNNGYNKNPNNHTRALWSTWNLSFSNLSTNAKSMLIMSSYLDADEISLNYFKNLTLEERDSAVAELKNYSFITINNNKNSFKIHRLLQEIVREYEGSESYLMKTIKLLDFSFAIYQHVDKDLCDMLIPHVISLAHHAIETPDLFHEGLALYSKAAMYSAYVQEDIKLSYERWSEILHLSKKHLSTEEGFHYLLANINTHFGFNNYLLGNLATAEQVLKQAKDIYEKPMTPISEKIETLLKDLRWKNQTSIKDDIFCDYAFALNAIANVESHLNKISSSEENYKKALHMLNQCKEKNKTDIYKVVYLLNMLRLYTQIKNLEKANLVASELNQIHDEDTSGITQSYKYERIGELRFFQDDYEGAKKLFEQALQIRSKVYAKNNYRLGRVLSRVGAVLILMNKPKAALECLEAAEKTYENHIAKHNINYLCLYFIMHCALEANQDYKNSTQTLKQLYDMILLSNNSDAYILISQQLPAIEKFNRLKASKKDMTYLQQSLELVNNIFGKDSLYASKYHYLLGTVFQNSLQTENAHYHFNTALNIILDHNIVDQSLKTQNDLNIRLIKEKIASLERRKG